VLLLVWFFIFDLSGKGDSTAVFDIALRIFTHESLHPMNILGKMKERGNIFEDREQLCIKHRIKDPQGGYAVYTNDMFDT